MLCLGWMLRWEILIQCPAKQYIHKLDAAADAEYRLILLSMLFQTDTLPSDRGCCMAVPQVRFGCFSVQLPGPHRVLRS